MPRFGRLPLARVLKSAPTGVLRARWGFLDQALSSLSNFALGIIVARSVDTNEFGAFALAFAIYLAALNASRAVTSLPLTIRFSAAGQEAWRAATAAAAGVSILVGLGFGLACVAFGIVAGGPISQVCLVLGPLLPGLLLQDLWRFGFFTRGTEAQAAANDGVWVLLELPLYALLLLSGKTFSVGVPLAIWGLSALAAALFGIAQTRIRPRLGEARGWWRAHHDIAPRYLGEYMASTGGDLVQPYGIGLVAGLGTVGTMRAGELLLGPFNIVFQGAGLVTLPEAARMLRVSAARLARGSVLISVALAGAAAAWGAFVLLIPDQLGVAIMGANWEPARSVLPPLALWLVGVGAGAGAIVGLRALAAARRSLRTRIAMTIISTSMVIAGAAIGGALGGSIAMAAATWLAVGVWWWQFALAIGEHRGTDVVAVDTTIDPLERPAT